MPPDSPSSTDGAGRTWPLRVCEQCLSDRYEVNDSVAKTFVCTDCGHESKTVRTLKVVEASPLPGGTPWVTATARP